LQAQKNLPKEARNAGTYSAHNFLPSWVPNGSCDVHRKYGDAPGYTLECSLKALVLHCTPDPDKTEKLKRLTMGSKMHRPDVLLGHLRDMGVTLPLDLAKRIRRFDWTTDLRYETGRRDTGETVAFLKTAKAIYDGVEGQLP
jgi:hypothetical protein